MPDLTPAQLLRIADLLRYPPSAADADERWDLVIQLRKQATDKETRHDLHHPRDDPPAARRQ